MGEPVALVPGKPDPELAAELRADLRPLLEQIAAIMSKARRNGLNVAWAITWDQFGRPVIQTIDVMRPL
jgi:hypothetical protein